MPWILNGEASEEYRPGARYVTLEVKVSDLLGLTMVEVTRKGEAIRMVASTGEIFSLHHEQDCCESVWLEDICGDLDDLVGQPLLQAEVAASFKDEWNFYKFATIRGSVTLRWCGSTDGPYSLAVDLWRLK